MAFMSHIIVDVSASVSPMDSYYFVPTTAGATPTIQGYFVDANGMAVGTAGTHTFTANTVITWLTVYNAWNSASLTALPQTVVGVRFDHSADISYLNATSAPSAAVCRLGPTWETQKNRAVGRNG